MTVTLITFNRHGLGFYGFNLPYSIWVGGITGAVVGYTALEQAAKRTPYNWQLDNTLLWTATISGGVINYLLWNAVEEVR